MIRCSFPAQAATRSWLRRDPRRLELFCSCAVGDRICDHFQDYDCAAPPRQTRACKMLPAISSWTSTGTTEVSASGNSLDDAGEGLFRITSRFAKCIDVPDASRDNGVYLATLAADR